MSNEKELHVKIIVRDNANNANVLREIKRAVCNINQPFMGNCADCGDKTYPICSEWLDKCVYVEVVV